MRQGLLIVLLCAAFAGCDRTASAIDKAEEVESSAAEAALMRLAAGDPAMQLGAIEQLDREWSNRLTPALLEYISLGGVPSLQHRAMELLRKHTGQDFGYDLNAWFSWVWQQEFVHAPYYADFKSLLYASIDPRFAGYFSAGRASEVQLDEVRWGGVRQDGIPPLRAPPMIPASAAVYLADGDVVFGLEVNGDVRAYPKRILAWHEMFVDTVGGVAVVGVYCTLCGSMILYESSVGGSDHEMGTSGFLVPFKQTDVRQGDTVFVEHDVG